jgi:hypothetical protein
LLFTAPYSNSFFAENFYFDFSKIWCWNYKFPWYAKVRENRLFRKRWLKLEYSTSQTLFLSIKNFSSYWLRPHCEKSRKMFLSAIESNPFKTNQQIRRWSRIFKSKAAPETKNFQNDARQETFKILKSLKMNLCIFEYSNFPPDHDLAEFFRDWDSTLWTIPKDIP